MSTLGFDGNQDIYGIGIRVGYYTQAASLWVANLWAPHEAPYLHTVTLLYLVALLVGVSVLSANPPGTHAIEPYMLMQVAYNTYYMGLYGAPTADLLVWERNYFKDFTTTFVALCLHGFDTWYWWVGIKKMIPTPGPDGTDALFTYFGKQDLYGWVQIPVKLFNTLAILVLANSLLRLVIFGAMRHRVDREMTPQRLKVLAVRWLREVDPTGIFSEDEPNRRDPADGEDLRRGHLSPPAISRHHSSASIRTSVSNLSKSRITCHLDHGSPQGRSPSPNRDRKDDRTGMSTNTDKFEDKTGSLHRRNISSVAQIDEPVPTPGIERTLSDRLRYRFLGWTMTGDQVVVLEQPSYTPEFQNLILAVEFLEYINTETPCKWKALRAPVRDLYSSLRFLVALFRHRIRPRFLVAMQAHMRLLSHSRKTSWPEIWRRALTHPAYRTLSSNDVAVASRISLTLHPIPPLKKWQVFARAYATAVTCSLLVIGTELAILWNNIRGVQLLNTVGQLIPFSLGVGGLLKVVWSAVFDREAPDRGCFGRCQTGKRRDEWEEASKAFERVRKTWEKKKEAREKMELSNA